MNVVTVYYKQIISTVSDTDCTFSFHQQMQTRLQEEKETLFKEVIASYGISDYQLAKDSNQKPYLSSHPDIHFNVSHTTDHRCMDKNSCIAIGFSPNEIGIDVEYIRDIKPVAAKKMCSPNEFIAYSSAANPTEYLTRLWTLKEAYAKFTGDGLKTDFHNLEFILVSGHSSMRIYHCIQHPEVVLYQYEPINGLFISVCVPSAPGLSVKLYSIE